MEMRLESHGHSHVQATTLVQSAINHGQLVEKGVDGKIYLKKANLIERLWAGRPWRITPPTAAEILSKMTPISIAPPQDTKRFGPRVSVPCVLAELRQDGSLLEHNQIAVLHYETGIWVDVLRRKNPVNFPATHYYFEPFYGEQVTHSS